jgi:hypothetical protein
LVALDLETLLELLAQSEATREAVERTVDRRLAENPVARESA